MEHPKRYMRDGMATTRRAHGVEKVECNNPYHVQCFEAVTSWAGAPIPRRDSNWHVYLDKSGNVCLLGPLVGRESVQFEVGLKRRVKNAIEKEN